MASIGDGQNNHSGAGVSAAIFDEQARTWARLLEDEEARSLGVPVAQARAVVARRTKVPKGTLENLRRDRVKGVRHWVYESLRAAFTEHQMRRLRIETERTAALVGTDHPDVVAAQAALDAHDEARGSRPSVVDPARD